MERKEDDGDNGCVKGAPKNGMGWDRSGPIYVNVLTSRECGHVIGLRHCRVVT